MKQPRISAARNGNGPGVSSETNRNLHLNSALWKLLTGGDTLTARDLYQSPHDFMPTAQIIILTNHPPLFDNHDKATINRMVIIPFLIEHKKGEKTIITIDNIIKSFKDEFPAIIKLLAEYYITDPAIFIQTLLLMKKYPSLLIPYIIKN